MCLRADFECQSALGRGATDTEPSPVCVLCAGKGRGKQVISAARTADLIFMVLEAEKADRQKELLTYELESVGIRINKKPPDVTVKIKKTGGVHFTTTAEQTHGVDEEMCKKLCQ